MLHPGPFCCSMCSEYSMSILPPLTFTHTDTAADIQTREHLLPHMNISNYYLNHKQKHVFQSFHITLFNFDKMRALIKYEASLVDCNYFMSRISSPYYYCYNHYHVMSLSAISLTGWYVIGVNGYGRESDSYSRNRTTNKAY